MLASTESRIESITDSPIDRVGSAISMAAATDRAPNASVSCYVVPVAESPAGNTHVSGRALQKVQITVGVVFAIRTLNDPDGERGSAKLETARNTVRDALFGWQPDSADVGYLLSASGLIRMDKNVIWWIDRYQTQIQRRAKV